MDLMLRILCACPVCWRFVGYVIFTWGGMSLFLFLGILLRTERTERKTGVLLDVGKLFEAIPLPVPSSPEEAALAAGIAVVGAGVAWAGKWAQQHC